MVVVKSSRGKSRRMERHRENSAKVARPPSRAHPTTVRSGVGDKSRVADACTLLQSGEAVEDGRGRIVSCPYKSVIYEGERVLHGERQSVA